MKKFEGDEVDGGYDIVIRQFRGDINKPLGLDEDVTLTVTAQVTAVNHEVNKRTGVMTRTHIVHATEVEA